MAHRHDTSVYTQAFPDDNALVFSPQSYTGDDASDALQATIYRIVDERNYGNLYIAEGVYNITKTIYIPRSVRLIGFGKTRPLFVLPANTPGFDGTGKGVDGGQYNSPGYPGAVTMFWFTSNRPTEEQPPADATAGTFYSALANVDFRIMDGNPMAVCVRAHFAQNAFVSHCNFYLGSGLSALYEVGNEMENLAVYGGKYGILCRQTSPSWPFVLMDCTFDGQKEAAIASWTTGLTLFRISVKNTKAAIIPFGTGNWEKTYMEDCVLENISDAAIQVDLENNGFGSLNARHIYCNNVPTPLKLRESGKMLAAPSAMYKIEKLVHGAVMQDMIADSKIDTIYEATPLQAWQQNPTISDIPNLPSMTEWVSIKTFGAVGDGQTDDTAALCAAAASGKAVFFPEGWYRTTNTIVMAENTQFIGMNSISTQIILKDDEPAFASFGIPVPLIETSRGFNLLYSLGIDSGGKNPRALAVKWTANAQSYMNDIKFVGGHGQVHKSGGWVNVYNANRTGDADPAKEWDFQYTSLLITDGGGGVFKNIWSASPYSDSGIAIIGTKTPGKIYCTSLEHHVRHELKMRDVENWAFYALQTEEEKAEGLEALPIEMVNCKNILFGNLWIFRTVYVHRPYPDAIRIWNCANLEFANVHNYTQMQYVFDNLITDPAKNITALPWEAALIKVTGHEQAPPQTKSFTKIASGLTFGSGAAVDSKGNLVFCDALQKRVYRWIAAEKRVELLCDLHWAPMCAVFDSQDNLAIVADITELRSEAQRGPRRGREYHPYYMWFGPRGPRVYTLDPNNPYETMQVVEPTPVADANPQVVYHPAHAWTPTTFIPEATKPLAGYYMLPDGKTAIAAVKDIGRSLLLSAAVPGKTFYMVDDSINRTYAFDVAPCGSLTNPKVYAENGRYGVLPLPCGTVIAPDGYIYEIQNGTTIKQIRTPERATCAALLKDGIALVCRNSVWVWAKE